MPFLPFSLALLWTACGGSTVDLGNGDPAANTNGIGTSVPVNGGNGDAGAAASPDGTAIGPSDSSGATGAVGGGASVSDGGSAASGTGASAGSDLAEHEVCLLDRCNDGAQSQVGCTPHADAAEECRLARLLIVGKTSVTDARGDGVISPGETVHIVTGLINTSTCDNASTPGVVLTSNYPGIPNDGGFVTFLRGYVMRGGAEETGTTDIVIPNSVKPGTGINFELTPTGPAGCAQPLKLSVLVGVRLE